MPNSKIDVEARKERSAMSEIEMLELAAKAAGYKFAWRKGVWETKGVIDENIKAKKGVAVFWDPLTDDGDAFRLVVKLKTLDRWDPVVMKKTYCDGWEQDPYAATRLAITRAAAEIGRNMP